LSDELEARVGERTAALNETIVELETFNYSVSHDLRSPLGAISNFAAILGEDYREVLDSTAAEYLQRIVQSATVAASMMDGLLAYSSSGRQSLNKTRVAMKRLVEEVATEVAAAWPQLECKMEIGNLPEAYADEGMMRFVWSNLISNACKFARPDQPPRVEISGQASDVEVTYCVRDHGMGFDMRYADRLFKVFERLHSADRQQGHGVGLAIVARMVRRHGGRVWAQGAEGKGATFYFSLPAGQERDEDGGRRT
jgi:light-regulated signal transduction histidine kinase (bacteriophytochrome)